MKHVFKPSVYPARTTAALAVCLPEPYEWMPEKTIVVTSAAINYLH